MGCLPPRRHLNHLVVKGYSEAECLQGWMMHTTFSAGRFEHGKSMITLKDMMHTVWGF